MGVASFLTTAALAVTAAAQFVSHSSGKYGISVNVPSDTASSKSGPIYFQISAPSGTQWAAVGQGSRMRGANMFVIYASGSNVILSPRTGTGDVMPEYDSGISASLLDGSGVQSDGSMVANVKCEGCLSWSGGSMDPTSTSSNWILAYKSGDALNTDDQSATISQHDQHYSFTLDLTSGTGGSSNPFAAASQSSSSSASASATDAASTSATDSGSASTTATGQTSTRTSSAASSTGSATSSISHPIASSNPNSSSSSSSDSGSVTKTPSTSPFAHGVLMSILFLGFFPLFALTLYLPTTKKVRFIHAPLQMISVILLIAGLALGIVYGKTIDQLGGYHQVIGYLVVAVMVLAQPAMGIYQHLHYHKTGGRSGAGVAHQWMGRGAIALGIVNGGLGWQLTKTTSAYVPYAVIAIIVFIIYVAVVVVSMMRQKRLAGYPQNKESVGGRGYEMHNPKEVRTVVREEGLR